MTVQGFTKWGMPCVIRLDENGEFTSAKNYLHGNLTEDQVTEELSKFRLVATD